MNDTPRRALEAVVSSYKPGQKERIDTLYNHLADCVDRHWYEMGGKEPLTPLMAVAMMSATLLRSLHQASKMTDPLETYLANFIALTEDLTFRPPHLPTTEDPHVN